MTPNTYPKTPGYKTTGTSKEAAKSARITAPNLRAQVLRQLSRRQMTADECAMTMRQTVLSIRPRFSELRLSGAIEPTGKRRENSSGKMATVWRVAK